MTVAVHVQSKKHEEPNKTKAEEKAHGIAGWFGKKADQGSHKLDGKDGKEKAENVADKVVSSVKGAAETTKAGLDDAGKQISNSTKGARDKVNEVSAPHNIDVHHQHVDLKSALAAWPLDRLLGRLPVSLHACIDGTGCMVLWVHPQRWGCFSFWLSGFEGSGAPATPCPPNLFPPPGPRRGRLMCSGNGSDKGAVWAGRWGIRLRTRG